MKSPSGAGMLFARLQLSATSTRSLVVAGVRSRTDARGTAVGLATAIADSGHRVRWLDLGAGWASAALPEGIEELSVLEAELGDVQRARNALQASDGYTVVSGEGILDSPRTLVLCAAADGVLVVVEQGKTDRADLEQARVDVERGGGRLLGAVLLK